MMAFKPALIAVVLTVGAAVLGLRAQPPEQPGADPGLHWLTQNGVASQEAARQIGAAQLKQQLEGEVALWEWTLNRRHASQELAREVWTAAAQYRLDPESPQARGVYSQALGAAHSRYSQALSAAYNVWTQAQSQAYQRASQEWAGAWQTLNNDLNRNWQRVNQDIQQLAQAPRPMTFEQLTTGLADAPRGEEEGVYRQKTDAAAAALAEALAQVDQVWQQESAAAARTGADPDEMDQTWRKANQKWLVLALDALEDYRAAGRAALRRYQLGVDGG